MTRTTPRLVFLGAAMLAAVLFVVVGSRRFELGLVLMIVAAPPVLALLFQLSLKHPALLGGLLCAVAVVLPGLAYWLDWPTWSQYIVDIMVFVFLATSLASRWRAGLRIHIDRPILFYYLLLIALMLVTRSFSLTGMRSLWAMFLGPLVVIAVHNSRLRAADARLLFRWLFFLCLLQLAVVAVEKFVFQVQNVDSLGGTLGRAGTTQLAILMSCFWVCIVALMTSSGRWRVGLWLFVPVLALAFAEAKAGFLFASIGSIFVAGAWFAKGHLGKGSVAFLFSVLPVLVGYLFVRYLPELVWGAETKGGYWLSFLTDQQAMWEYLQGYASGGQVHRLESLTLAWNTISSQAATPFGLGVGSLSTSGYFVTGLASTKDLIDAMAWSPSAGRILIETGVLGLSGLLLLILGQVRHGVRLLKAATTSRTAFGAALMGIVAIFLLGGFYTSVWTNRVLAIPFWVLMALACLRIPPQPPSGNDPLRVSDGRRNRGRSRTGARTRRATPKAPVVETDHHDRETWR